MICNECDGVDGYHYSNCGDGADIEEDEDYHLPAVIFDPVPEYYLE